MAEKLAPLTLQISFDDCIPCRLPISTAVTTRFPPPYATVPYLPQDQRYLINAYGSWFSVFPPIYKIPERGRYFEERRIELGRIEDFDCRGRRYMVRSFLFSFPNNPSSNKDIQILNQPALVYRLDSQSTKPRSSAQSLAIPSTKLPPAWISRVTTSPSPTHMSPFSFQFPYATPVT